MKLDKFYKDTLILTVSNLATGILRFVFSIILSNKLGAEGLGLYSLIMPLYDLFACATCGGIIVAVSRSSAILAGNDDYSNIHRLIRITILFELFWSIFISIPIFFNANSIALYFIKDSRTVYSIEMICPALIFIALSSVFKGYFYGISKAKIPAYIDIVEKAIRIAIVVGIVNIFFLKNMVQTISAVYAALTFGELISLLMLYASYMIYKNKYSQFSSANDSRSQLLFNTLTVSVPLCINGFLTSLLNTASTLIVPRRLVFAGFTYTTALSLIGKFTGMAFNITFFPMVVIMSMSTVLVPDISKSLNKKDYYSMEQRISEVIKLSFYIGISTSIISLCIPENLGKLFYGRNDLGIYIITSSLCAPITYAAASTYSILSGLEKQTKILFNSFLVSIEEIILLYILTGIPSINIYGYTIALLITSATSYFLNMYEINKVCSIRFYFDDIFLDMIFAILLFLFLGILNNILPSSLFIFKSVSIIILGFALYMLLVVPVKHSLFK